MKIRNKLLILLLSASLIPLVTYFVLDVSFSRIVRRRIQNTLGAELEDRARETLIRTIDNYQEKLTISAQAARYGLLHYADQVQCIFGPSNLGAQPPDTSRYILRLSPADISKEAPRYRLKKPGADGDGVVDFDLQFVHPGDDESGDLLRTQLPQLTTMCKDMYSLKPETRLWTYIVLRDGTVALYPSPGHWPFEAGRDLRQEAWYVNAGSNRQLTPTPRIEPLTGKTVMTVAAPLIEHGGSLRGNG